MEHRLGEVRAQIAHERLYFAHPFGLPVVRLALVEYSGEPSKLVGLGSLLLGRNSRATGTPKPVAPVLVDWSKPTRTNACRDRIGLARTEALTLGRPNAHR